MNGEPIDSSPRRRKNRSTSFDKRQTTARDNQTRNVPNSTASTNTYLIPRKRRKPQTILLTTNPTSKVGFL
eukprot:m.85053 g.85053  ORF g.85053 m.85053 type:complete len:71 (+) comp25826_c1_seq1:1016-1228(+)